MESWGSICALAHEMENQNQMQWQASPTVPLFPKERACRLPVLKEMSSEFIKWQHKAAPLRWKSQKVIWKKTVFFTFSTATDLMQLMVSHVTTCSSWAKREASPIRLGMKRGWTKWLELAKGPQGNVVSQVSLLPLSPLITLHRAPAGNHCVSKWILDIL